MIRHIVLSVFKEEHKHELEDYKRRLTEMAAGIKEVKKMDIFFNVGAETNYDAVLISEFESMDDFEKYLQNDKHKDVAAYVNSIREKASIIQFEV